MKDVDPRPPVCSNNAADIDQLTVRLQGKLGGRVRHLRLSLNKCGLILHGNARTYHAKQLAQHAVMTESNLPILANEIEVC